MTLRELLIGLGFKVDEQSQKKAENVVQNVKSMATKALGAIGIGFSLVNMNALAEEFNGVNDRIRDATRGMGEQAEIQKKIMAAARDTRVAYADTAKFVSALVQENKELFGTVDEAVEYASVTTKLFKAAGKSQEEIAGLQEAINKSFAKGIVDSETINQLYEKAPEAVNILADSLGVAKEQLAKMATDGALSLADLKNAFIGNADAIQKQFDELDYNMSDALLDIRNQWGFFLDEINSKSGFTKSLAKELVKGFSGLMDLLRKGIGYLGKVAEKLGGVKNLLKLVGAVAAGIVLSTQAGNALKFLKGLTSLLSVANLKLAAIAAVIAAVFLLIDDFIGFMQGKDSVIGSLFEKLGIDAEKARKTISGVIDWIKDFLSQALSAVKGMALKNVAALLAFWQKHGDQIKGALSKAWNAIRTVLSTVWGFLQSAATVIFGGLQKFFDEHGSSILSALSSVWNAIVSVLTYLWNALYNVGSFIFSRLGNVLKAVFEGLQKFWEKWGGKITSQFSVLWNTISGIIGGFIKVVQGVADFISGVFSGDWGKAWEGIKTVFMGIWEAIKSFFTGIWDSIQTWFGDKITSITETLVNGFNAAIEFLTSLPGKALQWGKDFIDGLIGGIKEKITGVVDAVKGVGEKIKSFLHFSVPDEGPLTDYQSWMPDFMQGLAQGIRDNAPMVLDALSALTQGMAGLGDVTIKRSTLNTITGGGSRTTNVNQDVKIENKFYGGDRAAQVDGAKALSKSAEDITDVMARGLAVGR